MIRIGDEIQEQVTLVIIVWLSIIELIHHLMAIHILTTFCVNQLTFKDVTF